MVAVVEEIEVGAVAVAVGVVVALAVRAVVRPAVEEQALRSPASPRYCLARSAL